MDLLIVPGIAYDREGNRMGQGVGFYDRFLEGVAGKIPIIAVAFELQIVPEVPVSSNDVGVNIIVTEKQVIKCGKG